MNPDIEKLVAVEVRLREVVRGIVRRHTSAGSSLSWGLMFDIEEEALSVLAADASLDARFVAMMAAPPRGAPCRTDRPVGMDGVNAMRTTLWMIQEAYYHVR